ncbi:MAG: hypothetical protein PHC64_06895 [Candidatus Gastranaerophilales bacterium]|nr:hypothetical protein [Candidatus Gastranaerophilales bacterium]
MLLLAPTPTTNEKQGSGRYSTLRRRKKQKKSDKPKEFSYLAKNTDLTMQFSHSRDPIYFAFEYLERKSLGQLMEEFVKDSFFEIANFVSKTVK